MPKNIVFATPETIIQPKDCGLVIEAPLIEQDHVLGGLIGGTEFSIQLPGGHWAPYAPEPELQRNDLGDLFMCVSFAINNVDEFLIKKQFGDVINFADTALGSGSGTIRGRGNSKRTVAEWKRKNGCMLEGDRPYTAKTTLDDAYKALTKAELEKCKKQLDFYQFPWKWVGDNSAKEMLKGLEFSPLAVDVLVSYPTNKDGYVVWDKYNPVYAHEVVLFDYEPNKCWWIFDSETEQYLKFAWDYPFGSPMIRAVPSNMRIQLFKKKGHAAICVKHFSEPSLIAFSGGSVSGDDLFKSIYGVSDFKSIPIKEVDELPFPIRHLINTNPQR